MKLKKHKNKIIAGVVIVAALVISFRLGSDSGKAGDNNDETAYTTETQTETVSSQSGESGATQPQETDNSTGGNGGIAESSPSGYETIEPGGGPTTEQPTQTPPTQDSPTPTPTPTEQPGSQESQPPSTSTPPPAQGNQQETTNEPTPTSTADVEQGGGTGQTDNPDREMTVTLTISCATILNNMDRLPANKAGLIPADGIIFSGIVEFYEDESVFNVLLREVRKNRIHMEFASSLIYNSSYIEGINNIYEFDCGEGSGWMYSVNGYFPNYGSSRYALKDGDVVAWQFTCDRGADIGGGDASGSYNFGG